MSSNLLAFLSRENEGVFSELKNRLVLYNRMTINKIIFPLRAHKLIHLSMSTQRKTYTPYGIALNQFR